MTDDALQRAVTRIGGVLIDLDEPGVMAAIDAWLTRIGRPVIDEPPCGAPYFDGEDWCVRPCTRFPGHLSPHGPAKIARVDSGP